jgi:prevent-host-death family protein
MYTIGVRAFRSELASVLRRAADGHSTLISDRGRPIARVGPIDDTAPDIDQLIASGGLIPPRRHGAPRVREAIRVWSGTRIDHALRELRG